MRVVIAPDSFKGSLDAVGVCEAIAAGISRTLPGAEVTSMPMADGGEGTVRALVAATGGRLCHAQVHGPLGEPVGATYGLLGDGHTAAIEMAQASGLPLVPPGRRDPKVTCTFGTGELIKCALDAGCDRLIIGIGGSATNDGGAGMARALGARLLDWHGRQLPPGGAALAGLARIDVSGIDPRLSRTAAVVACDVDNPLCGGRGASAVYGPQKGATPEDVAILDAALANYADQLSAWLSAEVRDLPGAGAAGGLGAGLVAFAGAQLRRGVDIVIEATRLAEAISRADLVITGEGCLDDQTAYGKTVHGVTQVAVSAGVPVIALVGRTRLTPERCRQMGLSAVLPIVPGPMAETDAIAQARTLLEHAAETLGAILAIG